MTSRRHHAPDQSGRGSTANAIALVRALGVVVAHEAVEGPLQGHATGEVVPTEGHTPVLLENRALQPFDKAVGPGMARFGARVPDAEPAAARTRWWGLGDVQRSLAFRLARSLTSRSH